jgi:hypothetical protein
MKLSSFWRSRLRPLGAQEKAEPKPDWERMKECAAQAEKIMARPDMRGQDLIQAHYSPKYGRCFLLTSYRKDGSIDQELIDAFELRVLADDLTMFRNGDRQQVCTIAVPGDDDEIRPCEEVRAYIQEHMAH